MPDAVEHCVGFHLPRTDSTNRPKVGAAASRTTGIQRSPGTWAFTQKPGSAREAGPQGASPAKAARPGWPGRFQPLARTRALCEQKNKIKGPLRGRLVQKPKVTSQCSAMLSLRLALQRRWQPEFQSLWRALLRGGDHDDSDRGRDIPAFTGSLTRQPVCAFVQKDMRGFDGYHGDTTIGRPISKPDVHVSASPNQMRRSICSAKGQAEPFPPPCQPRP